LRSCCSFTDPTSAARQFIACARGEQPVDTLRLSTPAATVSIPTDSLPISPTPFLGRNQDLAQIKTLLADSRLLILIGPGGVGKTRLALAAAQMLQKQFRDGDQDKTGVFGSLHFVLVSKVNFYGTTLDLVSGHEIVSQAAKMKYPAAAPDLNLNRQDKIKITTFARFAGNTHFASMCLDDGFDQWQA
jgi:hypothetical protein